MQWEKWGTYRSRILTCNNKSSHRKNEQLSNWACVVILMFIDICLFDVYCLLCRACRRHHTYDVKNVFRVYWVLLWCDNSLNFILFVVSNCICLSKWFYKIIQRLKSQSVSFEKYHRTCILYVSSAMISHCYYFISVATVTL